MKSVTSLLLALCLAQALHATEPYFPPTESLNVETKAKAWGALGLDLDWTPTSAYGGQRPIDAAVTLQGVLPGLHAELGGLYASGVFMRFAYDLRLPPNTVVIFSDGARSKAQLWVQSIRYGPGYVMELDIDQKIYFDVFVGGMWMQTLSEPGFGEEHGFLGMEGIFVQALGSGYFCDLGLGARFNKKLSNDNYSYLDQKAGSPNLPGVSFSGDGLFPYVVIKIERVWGTR